MSRPKLHRLLYFTAYGKGRIKSHHIRDGLAGAMILDAKRRQGFDEGEIILNLPPSRREIEQHGGAPALLVIDDAFLCPGDRVVVVTRPPISDAEQVERIRVVPGFTSWEVPVHEGLSLVCDICSRSHFRLLEWVAAELPEQYANRADMYFRVYNDASYNFVQTLRATHRKVFRGEPRTAVFLLHLERLESLRGAGLIIAFGMGGTETLGWAYRLQTDLSPLLEKPGFIMAELSNAVVPERPTDLRFFEKWEIEIVLQIDTERLVREHARRMGSPGPAGAPLQKAGITEAVRRAVR